MILRVVISAIVGGTAGVAANRLAQGESPVWLIPVAAFLLWMGWLLINLWRAYKQLKHSGG